MSVKTYWDALYSERTTECIKRVEETSRDFLTELRKNDRLFGVFVGAESLFEFGCGTGGMALYEKQLDPRRYYYGIDVSDESVRVADNTYKDRFTSFSSNRTLDDMMTDDNNHYTVSYSSNVLEHFKNPYAIIDKLLQSSDYLFITVPYDQQDLEDYDGEGGAGHVFTFTEDSFKDYNLLYAKTYFTHTWAHGLQLLAVIKA